MTRSDGDLFSRSCCDRAFLAHSMLCPTPGDGMLKETTTALLTSVFKLMRLMLGAPFCQGLLIETESR